MTKVPEEVVPLLRLTVWCLLTHKSSLFIKKNSIMHQFYEWRWHDTTHSFPVLKPPPSSDTHSRLILFSLRTHFYILVFFFNSSAWQFAQFILKLLTLMVYIVNIYIFFKKHKYNKISPNKRNKKNQKKQKQIQICFQSWPFLTGPDIWSLFSDIWSTTLAGIALIPILGIRAVPALVILYHILNCLKWVNSKQYSSQVKCLKKKQRYNKVQLLVHLCASGGNHKQLLSELYL